MTDYLLLARAIKTLDGRPASPGALHIRPWRHATPALSASGIRLWRTPHVGHEELSEPMILSCLFTDMVVSPKFGGTFLGPFFSGDPTIWGSIFGAPIFVNPHVAFGSLW